MTFNGRVDEIEEKDGIRWAIVTTSKGRKREWIMLPDGSDFSSGERVKVINRAGEPMRLENR